ncbi:LOW QUALITY PROTEIN: hypothetical protein MSG28_006620 [Choristoneura fumiferana]|uniref:Uncharacterized protein n=1 Tax=Choristoneura fumiferana TaxID=7141 RepID=A0ACC0JFN5_CHOFU|nr:LOW QUALITY PROTEIN: hypothetical protein MSG28_006620 [Choristoneura fumiferana]
MAACWAAHSRLLAALRKRVLRHWTHRGDNGRLLGRALAPAGGTQEARAATLDRQVGGTMAACWAAHSRLLAALRKRVLRHWTHR